MLALYFMSNCLWKLGILAFTATLYLNTNCYWYLLFLLLIFVPVVDKKEFMPKGGNKNAKE